MLPQKPSKEESYQYLISIFKEAQVDTKEKALSHIDGLVKKSWRASIVPVFIIFLGGTLAPKYLFFWLLFFLLGLAWIWSSTFLTSRMMKRYIKEELSEQASPKE
jgi:hypothetical protein